MSDKRYLVGKKGSQNSKKETSKEKTLINYEK